MRKMDKWLIALDFSSADTQILKYAKFFCSFVSPKEVHFLHVQQEDDFESLPDNLRSLKEQVLSDKELKMKDKVMQYFPETSIKKYFYVLEGNVVYETLNLDNYFHFDLLIMGKKTESEGLGLSTDRLAKKMTSHILIVPENARPKLENILIPTDYSTHAKLALETGLSFYRRNTSKIRLNTYHIFKVPFEYSLEHTEEDLSEIIRAFADKKMARFTGNHRHIKPLYEERGGRDIAFLVKDQVKKQDIDLVIAGSKGHTHRSLVMLGSNSLKMIHTVDGCPLLIIKEPGENKGLFESLTENEDRVSTELKKLKTSSHKIS